VLKRKFAGPPRALRGRPFRSRGINVHEIGLRPNRDRGCFMRSPVPALIANSVYRRR
jgi:hypothetical protein